MLHPIGITSFVMVHNGIIIETIKNSVMVSIEFLWGVFLKQENLSLCIKVQVW